MIQSFKTKVTERFWDGELVKQFEPFAAQAMRKLVMLATATSLSELRIVPGNQLEALKGDRRGQHSVRINQKWRVCFIWTASDPAEVEIVDYHS